MVRSASGKKRFRRAMILVQGKNAQLLRSGVHKWIHRRFTGPDGEETHKLYLKIDSPLRILRGGHQRSN